jgi:hypothetical protein
MGCPARVCGWRSSVPQGHVCDAGGDWQSAWSSSVNGRLTARLRLNIRSADAHQPIHLGYASWVMGHHSNWSRTRRETASSDGAAGATMRVVDCRVHPCRLAALREDQSKARRYGDGGPSQRLMASRGARWARAYPLLRHRAGPDALLGRTALRHRGSKARGIR